jgi:hypothetical protein
MLTNIVMRSCIASAGDGIGFVASMVHARARALAVLLTAFALSLGYVGTASAQGCADCTVTTVVSSLNPSTQGAPVTFTATVARELGGAAPTGSMQFNIDAMLVATVPIVNGVATYTTSTIAVGNFHMVIATYVPNGGLNPSNGNVVQVFNPTAATTTTLASSLNPSTVGAAVTFTATVTSASGSPAGTVTFTIDGAAQPTVTLAGGTASLTTASLSQGNHTVVATYASAGGHLASTSATLTQVVNAAAALTGTVTIRQVVTGADGSFAFASATAALNLTVATSGGAGSASATLAAGTYAVTAADMTAAGYTHVAIECSNAASSASLASRTATIVLAAGETVVCTFVSVRAAEASELLIDQFLAARGSLILLNQPDLQRRIDRLNGVATASTGVGELMAMFPAVAGGGQARVHGSLAGFPGRTSEQSRFDVWFEARFQGIQAAPNAGSFVMGAIGGDYLFTPRLLAGVFVSVDNLALAATAGTASAAGTGWLLGGYVTGKLGANLYLDGLVAGGTSWNTIRPTGTFTDQFTSVRALASSTLHGDWRFGAWTFSPRARLSYYLENAAPYASAAGVTIAAVNTGIFEAAVGPGIAYRFTTASGTTVAPGIRADVVARLRTSSATGASSTILGRIEPRIDVRTAGGFAFGLSGLVEAGANHFVYGGSARLSIAFD